MKYTCFVICALLALVIVWPAMAAPRTTPTTVENTPTVKVDPTDNTVKVDPTGNTIKVDPSANTVKVDSTQNIVKIDGTVNSVKISPSGNTVQAQQSGTWNVGISGANNSVKPLVNSTLVQLFSTSVSIPAGGSLQSDYISCAGYREIRVVIGANTADPDLVVHPYFRTPAASYLSVGTADFAVSTSSITDDANFRHSSNTCVFSMPVMSDTFYIKINNNTASARTINNFSWVYLID